jgi:hypothetical protein
MNETRALEKVTLACISYYLQAKHTFQERQFSEYNGKRKNNA